MGTMARQVTDMLRVVAGGNGVDLPEDRLDDMFRRQREFIQILIENDKLPEHPVDITSKYGQRLIKEMIFGIIEELMEASFTLKNRGHKFTDDKDVDFAHYREELGDALAYFLEVMIYSGISPADIYAEYVKKNQAVKDRAKAGY